LKAGAVCSFTNPRGAQTGTCFTPDASKPLACKPAGTPDRPQRAASAPPKGK
jgi:hypothetical protein